MTMKMKGAMHERDKGAVWPSAGVDGSGSDPGAGGLQRGAVVCGMGAGCVGRNRAVGSEKNRDRLEKMFAYMAGVLGRAGQDDATVSRRLDTAATAKSGFRRWANRGMLYGGRFLWETGEVW